MTYVPYELGIVVLDYRGADEVGAARKIYHSWLGRAGAAFSPATTPICDSAVDRGRVISLTVTFSTIIFDVAEHLERN